MYTPQPPPRHCRLTSAIRIAGTWRTHALAAEDAVSKVANDIPVEYAAALSVNPATAHLLLSEFVQLKAGDVVVQNAANSAVGQAVIQLAKLRGVKTVSIIRDRADYKQVVEQLKALGGDGARRPRARVPRAERRGRRVSDRARASARAVGHDGHLWRHVAAAGGGRHVGADL